MKPLALIAALAALTLPLITPAVAVAQEGTLITTTKSDRGSTDPRIIAILAELDAED